MLLLSFSLFPVPPFSLPLSTLLLLYYSSFAHSSQSVLSTSDIRCSKYFLNNPRSLRIPPPSTSSFTFISIIFFATFSSIQSYICWTINVCTSLTFSTIAFHFVHFCTTLQQSSTTLEKFSSLIFLCFHFR